jgi:hypothetical protein
MPRKGSDRYIIFDHKQIHKIVKDSVELRKDYMHSKVYDFIHQYLKILEEKTMQNAEFINICTKLYVEHKDAITAIMTYGKPSLPIAYLNEFHDKTATTSFMRNNNSVKSYYMLIPTSWEGVIPETNVYTGDKYLVGLNFYLGDLEKHALYLNLWVGNFPDQNERNKFIDKLKEADKNSILDFRKEKQKVTTLFHKPIPLKHKNDTLINLHDYEIIRNLMVEAYNAPDTGSDKYCRYGDKGF